MAAIKATDRPLNEWYTIIETGKIKLPRFQRHEAWDRKRICSMLTVMINNLPLGVTLLLNVGDEPKFIDRYIETAPETNNSVHEHLLDGQQRLTAFWRMMNNNYSWETYFVYLPEYDNYHEEKLSEDEIIGFCQPRWLNKERKFPMWCDSPKESYIRGLFPVNIFKPIDPKSSPIDQWISQAIPSVDLENMQSLSGEEAFHILQKVKSVEEEKKLLKDKLNSIRETIFHYNLPFLALPSSTKKETALNVFINMNTNSKPLSQYDIVVAEVESATGVSLHDLIDELNTEYPNVQNYFDIDDLVLYTSALIQDQLPNQRGIFDMDKAKMIANWSKAKIGLSLMSIFLENQGIYDRQRLPTNAVLAVISALYTYLPDKPDEKGRFDILLKKYLWRSFFTDRYENAAASRAFADYKALKSVINKDFKNESKSQFFEESDIPLFNETEFPISTMEELRTVKWPKQENIRGRAILAVSSLLGAYDFADGSRITKENIKKRDYHHLYPDALLKEAEIESYLALNCALISGGTNKTIGRKDPLEYLKDRYNCSDEEIVNQRLRSHLVPIKELKNGGYQDLSEDGKNKKLKSDFENFLNQRAKLFEIAAFELCNGKNITYTEIFTKYSNIITSTPIEPLEINAVEQ